MCFIVKQSNEFKTLAPLSLSTKPSLVQLPNQYVSTNYEDAFISLKPPCKTAPPPIESEVSMEYKSLEDNLADIIFENIASLEQYEKEELVDMEDDEITELWCSFHGDKHPNAGSKKTMIQDTQAEAKQEVKPQSKVKRNVPKAEIIARGPKILFKKKPAQRVYTAKSA